MKTTDRLLQSFLGDTPLRRHPLREHSVVDQTKEESTSKKWEEEGEEEARVLYQLRFPSGDVLDAEGYYGLLKMDMDGHIPPVQRKIGLAGRMGTVAVDTNKR